MIPVKSKGKIRSIAEWLFLSLLFGGLWFAADFWTKHPELKNKYFPSPQSTPEVTLPVEERLKPAEPLPKTTLQLAEEALQDKRPKKALRFLKKWIRQNPNDKTAYLYLGRISLMEEDFDDAQDFFETVLKLEPFSKEALEGIARANVSKVPALIKRSKWREASDLLKVSKVHTPNKQEWQELWEEVGPRMEWVETSGVILQILEGYQEGNKLFLKGWASLLPNSEALSFFRKAQTEFQIALSTLESNRMKLSKLVYSSLADALENRLESTETVINFAGGVSTQMPQDWEEVNDQLQSSNVLIRRTVTAFEKLIASHKGVLTSEEERQLEQHIESTLKGILVVFSK